MGELISRMIHCSYSGLVRDVQLLVMTLNEYLIELDRRVGLDDTSDCSTMEQLQIALEGRYQ